MASNEGKDCNLLVPTKTVLRVKRKRAEVSNGSEPVCKALRVAKRTAGLPDYGIPSSTGAIFYYATTVAVQDDVSNVLNRFEDRSADFKALERRATLQKEKAPLATAESDDDVRQLSNEQDTSVPSSEPFAWRVVDVDADRIYKQQSQLVISCNDVALRPNNATVDLERREESGVVESTKMDTANGSSVNDSDYVYDIFVLRSGDANYEDEEIVYEATDYGELYDFGGDYRGPRQTRLTGKANGFRSDESDSEREIDYPDEDDADDEDADVKGRDRYDLGESQSGSESQDEYADDDNDSPRRFGKKELRTRLERLNQQAARLGDCRLSDSDEEDPEDAAYRRFKPQAADLRPLGGGRTNVNPKLDIGKFFK